MKGSVSVNMIKVITDDDFGLEKIPVRTYETRFASRGIVVRENGDIAVFNKKNKNEYKLPGGGIETDETPEQAFIREVLEETGAHVEITAKMGIIEEVKTHSAFRQISNIFVGKVTSETNRLSLTPKEQEEGGALLWINPKEALEKITNCIDNLVPSKYENIYQTKFIVFRDRCILEKYLKEYHHG